MFKTKYKKKYCKMLISHMAEGYSFESFGAKADCGIRVLYDWCKVYPEFDEAKEQGCAKALQFFERRLRIKLGAKTTKEDLKDIDISAIELSALMFALKTRFHKQYGNQEKLDLTSSDGSMSPTTPEQRQKLAEWLLKKNKEQE